MLRYLNGRDVQVLATVTIQRSGLLEWMDPIESCQVVAWIVSKEFFFKWLYSISEQDQLF